jgi:hypothetical protein
MLIVNDPDRQIPEFLFKCDEEPWIAKCKEQQFLHFRKFFMLIDEKGNHLEEVINKRDVSNNTILVSRRKKAETPSVQQIMETVAYPSFLFQLEREDFEEGFSSFFIIASSGRLLTSDDQDMPELVMREDHCTISMAGKLPKPVTHIPSDSIDQKTGEANTSTNLTLAETTNLDKETGQSVVTTEYSCDQAKWSLRLIDDKYSEFWLAKTYNILQVSCHRVSF